MVGGRPLRGREHAAGKHHSAPGASVIVSAEFYPRGHGLLDAPLSRGMTSVLCHDVFHLEKQSVDARQKACARRAEGRTRVPGMTNKRLQPATTPGSRAAYPSRR